MSINSQPTIAIGTSASNLDIYIRDTATNELITPSGITYDIYDPANTPVVSGVNGTYVSLGRYSASGTVIPNGFVVGEGWAINWNVILEGGVFGTFIQNFCTTLPTLSASFSSTLEEVSTIYDRVRLDLGDWDGQIFTDGILQRTLSKAIARVNRRLGLVELHSGSRPFYFYLYFTSALQRPKISVDLDTGMMTPDTDPYVDIVVLQMEEILLRAEATNFKRFNSNLGGTLSSGLVGITGEGVSVTNADGVKIAVSAGRYSARAKMFAEDVDRIAKEIERAIRDFRWRLSGSAGLNVTIPRYYYGAQYTAYNGYGGYPQ